MRAMKQGILFVLVVGVTALMIVPMYLYEFFGIMNFDQLLFVLVSENQGANMEVVKNFIKFLVPYLLFVGSIAFVIHIVMKYEFSVKATIFGKTFHKILNRRFHNRMIVVLLISAFMMVPLVYNSSFNISGYIYERQNPSLLFEEEYVDPNSVSITFPDEKRNLIYIVLESLNTNFNSMVVDNGVVNLIPNLEMLASSNVNFSNTDGFGGFSQARGMSWTIGALVGLTSGVPLQVPISRNSYGQNGVFLPGITTIGEVLEDAGYQNYFMIGSVAGFGGRETYFKTHGNYEIYDLDYWKEIGYIPQDYHVFWGMEDLKLLDQAKHKLTEIAAKDEPFNFTMLTVDTHYTDGYSDQYCALPYSSDYANAIQCSDKKIGDFITWITQQDFYENTTVIISGDHDTMNNEFLNRSTRAERTVFNTFLNLNFEVDQTVLKNRSFTAMDFFPTTLRALNVDIEGNRLGLGTDLFSGQTTLAERLGLETLDYELSRKSIYYEEHFFKK